MNLLRPIDEDPPNRRRPRYSRHTAAGSSLKVRVLRVHHAASCFDLIAEFVEVAFVLGVAHQRRVIAGKNDGSMVRAACRRSGRDHSHPGSAMKRTRLGVLAAKVDADAIPRFRQHAASVGTLSAGIQPRRGIVFLHHHDVDLGLVARIVQ